MFTKCGLGWWKKICRRLGDDRPGQQGSACTLHTAHCTLLHYTLHTAHCILHATKCTLQAVHCTLKTVHLRSFPLPSHFTVECADQALAGARGSDTPQFAAQVTIWAAEGTVQCCWTYNLGCILYYIWSVYYIYVIYCRMTAISVFKWCLHRFWSLFKPFK